MLFQLHHSSSIDYQEHEPCSFDVQQGRWRIMLIRLHHPSTRNLGHSKKWAFCLGWTRCGCSLIFGVRPCGSRIPSDAVFTSLRVDECILVHSDKYQYHQILMTINGSGLPGSNADNAVLPDCTLIHVRPSNWVLLTQPSRRLGDLHSEHWASD